MFENRMVAETPIILSREELIALNQVQAVKITTLIPTPAIGIDDTIGHNFAGHDGHQRLTRSIRNDLCINPSTTLK